MAIGAIAPMVPIEVPIAVAIKDDITKIPGKSKLLGIIDTPRFTVDSHTTHCVGSSCKGTSQQED